MPLINTNYFDCIESEIREHGLPLFLVLFLFILQHLLLDCSSLPLFYFFLDLDWICITQVLYNLR